MELVFNYTSTYSREVGGLPCEDIAVFVQEQKQISFFF
jgi:hypothetical protein